MYNNIIYMSTWIIYDKFLSMGKKARGKYTEFIAVRVDPELRDILEQLAAIEDRSTGSIARILLREAVDARAKLGFTPERRKKPGAEGSRKRQIRADEME